ncbi:MAG: hypothetical protein KDD70_15755, partial [Bdellovibrionales bacterium]|nr:hypothetical protein [Bdellovibrionales bacterium]
TFMRFLAKNYDLLFWMLLSSIAWIIHFPGFFSVDSSVQMNQAVSGEYTVWHPPVMSFTWRYLNQLIAGPDGMFLIQYFAYIFALLFVVRASKCSALYRSLLLIVCFLFPPFFIQFNMIWKDSQHAAVFLLATSLLIYAEKFRILLIPALALLFYGVSIRHNAIVAFVPISFWVSLMVIRVDGLKKHEKILKVLLASILQIALMSIGSRYLTSLLVTSQYPNPLHAVFLYDLKAISLRVEKPLLPDYLLETEKYPDVGSIRTTFEPRWVNSDHSDLPGNEEQAEELKDRWVSVLMDYPLSYLKARWGMYSELLGLARENVCEPFFPHHFAVEDTLQSTLRRSTFSFLDAIQNSLLFRGWFYVLLLGFICLLSFYFSGLSAGFFVAISGFLYATTYFSFTHSCSFRYFYWPICAFLFASCYLINALVKPALHSELK